MLSTRVAIMSAVVFGLLFVANAKAASVSQADMDIAKLAAVAKPMKAAALEKMYAGKTWKWKTGAGFFSTDRHRFAALSRAGSGWYVAHGDWYATKSGKLCMRAIWRGKPGNNGSIKCFLHREKHGVIYQKPSLGGNWYVFMHNPAQKFDEASKLVAGDRVSKNIKRIEADR